MNTYCILLLLLLNARNWKICYSNNWNTKVSFRAIYRVIVLIWQENLSQVPTRSWCTMLQNIFTLIVYLFMYPVYYTPDIYRTVYKYYTILIIKRSADVAPLTPRYCTPPRPPGCALYLWAHLTRVAFLFLEIFRIRRRNITSSNTCSHEM